MFSAITQLITNIKGISMLQTQVDQLTAQVTALTTEVATSVANTDKLMAAVTAAHATVTALSASLAAAQAAVGPAVNLQPLLDLLAGAQQSLADATKRDLAPAPTSAPTTPTV